MKNIKNKLFVPVILIAVIIAGIMLFNTDLEHIEDTNGADNFELQTITDEDIINEFVKLLNDCEFERYAPIGDKQSAMDHAFNETIKFISTFENTIKK